MTGLKFSGYPLGQIPGTTTNDNALAGNIGEYLSTNVPSGFAIALVTATPKTIVSLALTAGDWDVFFDVYYTGNAATTVTRQITSLSETTNALDGTNGAISQSAPQTSFAASDFNVYVGPVRKSYATTTTVYGVAQLSFAVNTASAYGIIRARRVR